ncbi:MAG: class I SAM-dependent methyltransferase [Polyangiaceae bacterium]
MSAGLGPKARFTDRVEDYVRFRPGYPQALLDAITRIARLGPGRRAADVGSGTGIFTRALLATGTDVVGVEPNDAMRRAAEASLSGHPQFESSSGCAEATGLADASVDLIVAAQAFHWFEPLRARAEFMRILKPGGYVALVWNQRSDTPFNRAYEAMLERFAPDYGLVREKDRAAESKIRAFFAPSLPRLLQFDNEQRLDEVGLRGRLMSSSYAPRQGDPLHVAIMSELATIFSAHEKGSLVAIGYETILWYAPRD